MQRANKFKLLLWSLIGLAAAAGITRFARGLGSMTSLTDNVPWGLWIGFDVMSGVALAAGGFVVTAFYYIFKREEFHPIARPAVLTAFLGYVAVVFGLLFDLGLPWNIWHMIVFWNPHSPLFEVGWCVMLYSTVLLLEFSPVPLESTSKWASIRQMLLKARLPLVIAGISLSTLHQSSLGSLFLIMPHRVHPLWYSPMLPVLFFLSAIALGFLMVTFESLFTGFLYKRKPEPELLGKVGSILRWVLLLFLFVRFGDIVLQGKSAALSAPGWQTSWFWIEIAIAGVIPLVLLFLPRVRYTTAGQWSVALSGVTGIVLNRINVGGFAHLSRGDEFYFPAWSEVAISAGVVAVIALVFMFIVERFNVWERRPSDPADDPLHKPEFDNAGQSWLGTPSVAARTVNSLAFVIFAALGFAILAQSKVEGNGIPNIEARRARGGDTLWIDGNRDGYGVRFAHKAHILREGDSTSCVQCHHFDLPDDRGTACAECHNRMYLAAAQFHHDWHSSLQGASLGCFDCHRQGEPKSRTSAKACNECHKNIVKTSKIVIDDFGKSGYVDALHQTCIGCHQERSLSLNKEKLPQCASCHDARTIPGDFRRTLPGKRAIVPGKIDLAVKSAEK